MAEISDEIIMKRVKQDQLSDLSVLFDRYHVRIYNFFLKLTFDRNVSHDLTQNLFYRIIRYRKTYREDSSFRTWMYQMARNVHIDHCKQQKRTNDHFQQVDHYYTDLPEDDENFTEDDYGRLDKALSRLSAEQQEIIVLSRYQGLKYEEISQIRNTSVANIKVQMHRAVKQLKEFYFKII